MERALATIRRIADIQPIEGADRIEVATVDGWQVVVAKEVGHKIGDLVIYFEIDSLLPEFPEYEFLRKNSYVKNSLNGNGFRLKTIKLRKQISQGLIMPCENLSEEVVCLFDPNGTCLYLTEGDDVTEFLGVKKYEKILGATLSGMARGNFPSFVPKTDAERIQNCFKYFERNWKDHTFEATIKLDGTSATFYYRHATGNLDENGEFLDDSGFGVCSRNLDLKESDNAYWQIAKKYNIEEKLRNLSFSVAIQGEIIGPGIQGNPEKLTEIDFFVFNIYNIDEGRYLDSFERQYYIESLCLKEVPWYENRCFSEFTVKDFLDYAEGKSLNASEREGVVFKSLDDPNVQFKAISNKWLLKND